MQMKCPHCSKPLQIPDSAVGKKVKCPVCSKPFSIPTVGAAKPAAPKPPPREEDPPTKATIKMEVAPPKRKASDRMRGRRGRSKRGAEDARGLPKKSGKGKTLKILGIGCLAAILIAIGLGYYACVNAKKLLIKGGRAVVVSMIESTDLPKEQKDGLIKQIDRVVDACNAKKISLENAGKTLEDLSNNTVIKAGMIYMTADSKYLQPSALTDEEKEQGKLSLQRFARGVAEKKIGNEDIDAIITLMNTRTEDGQEQVKEKMSEEELKTFLLAVKTKADDASIPEEPYEFDVVGEFTKIVDSVLEKK